MAKGLWQSVKPSNFKESVRSIFRKAPLPASKDGRHVPLSSARTTLLIDERSKKAFIDNTVNSSRYSIWDFLPRQIFFQFTKLANLYLLIIALLQFVPGLSPTSNYTGIIPLLVMISISISKEGYDDYRRHKLDKAENNNVTRRLAMNGITRKKERNCKPCKQKGKPLPVCQRPWEGLKWQDVKVGDIVQLERDEDVPADMVLLHAESLDGIAYVETAGLDGEANLKPKKPCAPLSRQCKTLPGLIECRARAVVEDPNIDLYEFNGRIEIDNQRLPIDMNGVMLRGSVLRNTESAIGLVVNTGEECRIRMNANKNIRTKAPELQKAVNRVVLIVVFFVLCLVAYVTTTYQVYFVKHFENNAWYLKGAGYILAYSATANVLLLNTFIPLAMCMCFLALAARVYEMQNCADFV